MGSHREKYNSPRIYKIGKNDGPLKLEFNGGSSYVSSFKVEKIESKENQERSEGSSIPEGFNFKYSKLSLRSEGSLGTREIRIKSVSRNNNKVSIICEGKREEGGSVVVGGFYGHDGWWMDAMGLILKSYNKKQLNLRMNHEYCICFHRSIKRTVLSHPNNKEPMSEKVTSLEVGGLLLKSVILNVKNGKLKKFLFGFVENFDDQKEIRFSTCKKFIKSKENEKGSPFDRSRMPILKVMYNKKSEDIIEISQEIPENMFQKLNKSKTFNSTVEEYVTSLKSLNLNSTKKKDVQFLYFSPFNRIEKILYFFDKKGNIKFLGLEYRSFD
jgi:hypothetical protein